MAQIDILKKTGERKYDIIKKIRLSERDIWLFDLSDGTLSFTDQYEEPKISDLIKWLKQYKKSIPASWVKYDYNIHSYYKMLFKVLPQLKKIIKEEDYEINIDTFIKYIKK